MKANPPWVILTGEFPPDCGGVGDYTAQLATSLAEAGDEVTVVRPPSNQPALPCPGVSIVTLRDHYGAGARHELDRLLDRTRPRVLVQYVAQAFGMRGANVLFCRWLHRRFRGGDDIRLMIHEPYFYVTMHPGHAALAACQRAMAAILLRSSGKLYVSTEAWLRYLKPYAPRGFTAATLPIPSAIPPPGRDVGAASLRARVMPSGVGTLIGHFGTYGDHVAPLVEDALVSILTEHSSAAALCLGAGSAEFVRGVTSRHPALAARISATGRLAATDVAAHLQSCDVLVQPYPDGVTTRRTSIMAGLAAGRAIVTTDGELTETIWRESRAVRLVPAHDRPALVDAVRHLLSDRTARATLAARAASVYKAEFAIERTIAVLREVAVASVS